VTSHPIDSALLGHLWSTPELHAIFGDQPRMQSWLDILAALAQAQADVGLIPAEAAAAIGAPAQVQLLDLAEVAARGRATGHSTLGLIQCLQAVLPEHAREWVYDGATVQDVSDTWVALTARRMADIAARDLSRIQAAAAALARRYRDSVMSGRTHGQAGLPITFGFKAAVWVAELRRHQERIAQGRRRWEVAQLGGALGTMEFWGERALPLLDAFAARLDLAAPEIPWLTARDRVAEFTAVLAMITGTLGKIGQEVYELQRSELAEVYEPWPPGQVGSITMPHKRNPELSEQLVSLSRLVRADAAVVLEGMVHEHERDGRAWKAEWVAVPEACLLTGAALAMGVSLLEGLQVDEQRMRANLDDRQGYPLSEPVMRLATERLGKHTAHALVYEAARTGLADGVDLAGAIAGHPVLGAALDAAEVAQALDPAGALGAATAFVDRVLAAGQPANPAGPANPAEPANAASGPAGPGAGS
jgi:adenylosuccinate lyase